MSQPAVLTDAQSILATITSFLSGIRTCNPALMQSLILPSGSATLIRRGKPLCMPLNQVVERIDFSGMTPGDNDEVIYNVEVRVDGELGMAWTPYLFYVTDYEGSAEGAEGRKVKGVRVNHTGTNIFSLWKRSKEGGGKEGEAEGDWIITGVQDIAREVNPPKVAE